MPPDHRRDATGETAIRLDDVSKRYPDGTVAVSGLSLDVARGETVALVGPSGCGKSTTLRMVNRLVEPTGGRIVIEGQDVTHADAVQLRRGIGYVIQRVGLFPHQTVAQNVATVPTLLGWDGTRTRERVSQLLELVGLPPDTYSGRYPDELSGGQQQRVGVARALAADPPILLMDEPFAAVDPLQRGKLQDEFLAVQAELGKTVLLVTHDIDEAVKLGDRVAVLGVGGTLEQLDTPERLLARPASEKVATFLGVERGIRRLAVTPLTEAELVQGDGVDGTAPELVLRLGDTLQDALSRLVTSGRGSLPVVDEQGTYRGTVTADGVLAGLRREVPGSSSSPAGSEAVPDGV